MGELREDTRRLELRDSEIIEKPLLESTGGTFDVVIARDLLPAPPIAGSILAGWFWLSGRLFVSTARPKSTPGWMERLVGRAK